jgi:hypothetical protein
MINKDKLNLLYIMPVSARAIFFPYMKEQDAVAQLNENSTKIDSVALFLATRVFDYAGVFGSGEWSSDDDAFHLPTFKAAFAYPLGGAGSSEPGAASSQGSTLGLVIFKGLSAAADPFNSLGGRDRSLTWGDETKPVVLTKGWTFDFWSEGNIGLVAHGYFLGNRLYAAVGAMRGGLSTDASGGVLSNLSTTAPSSWRWPRTILSTGTSASPGTRNWRTGPLPSGAHITAVRRGLTRPPLPHSPSPTIPM